MSEILEKMSEYYNNEIRAKHKNNYITIGMNREVYNKVKEMAKKYNLPLSKVVKAAVMNLYNETKIGSKKYDKLSNISWSSWF